MSEEYFKLCSMISVLVLFITIPFKIYRILRIKRRKQKIVAKIIDDLEAAWAFKANAVR